MDYSAFNLLIEDTFLELEDKLETHNSDIEIERTDEILDIILSSGSRIVLSRQAPLQQLWVASKNRGYHFEYKNNEWICNRTGIELNKLIDQLIET